MPTPTPPNNPKQHAVGNIGSVEERKITNTHLVPTKLHVNIPTTTLKKIGSLASIAALK